MNITTYDFIDSNKKKTLLLIFLFPISLAILLFITLYIYVYFTTTQKLEVFNQLFNIYWFSLLVTIALSTLWTFLSFYCGNYFLLNSVEATKVKDGEYKQIKRIIENISITAGIPTPKLYILEHEESLNAFATGKDPQHSVIVLTEGLILKLDNSELEAVIAHEIAHILYRDTKLMMTLTLLIGFFTFVGTFLLKLNFGKRSGGRKRNNGAIFILLIGLVFYIYGNCIAPIIRFAISRTREFQADAKSALLTRNPQALISALKKISCDFVVDKFENNELMAPMCIVSPLRKKITLFDSLSNLSSTHPPIEERIKALEIMDGRRIDLYQ